MLFRLNTRIMHLGYGSPQFITNRIWYGSRFHGFGRQRVNKILDPRTSYHQLSRFVYLLKVTFDFDKFSREVHTKTTSMMVESSMNVCLIALSSILRYNICQMESLNCLNTKKPRRREIRFRSCRFCVDLS